MIFELSNPITEKSKYRHLMNALLFIFPEADSACLDPARYFEPSIEIKYINGGGRSLDSVAFNIKLSNSEIGSYVKHGAADGSWHKNAVSLLGMLQKQSVSMEYANMILTSIAIRKGNGVGLDDNDQILIEDIYNRYAAKEESKNVGLIPDDESQIKSILKQRNIRKNALSDSLPFIDPVFDELGLKIIRGLTLIGNESGKGKTTAVVNIAARILSATNKKVIILAGEVPAEEYYCAIASVLEEVDYYQYRDGSCGLQNVAKVEGRIQELVMRLRILDNSHVENLHSPVTALQLLNEAKKSGFGIAIIDYYQIFDQGSGNQIDVIKKFGADLNRFCSESSMPVVLMAQLREASKDFFEPFNKRIQQDRYIFNHCQLAIEMVTDLKRNWNQFFIRKTRYAKYLDKNIVLKFSGGKLKFDEDASKEMENESL